MDAFHSTKYSGLKFWTLHVLIGTVHSGCKVPAQATARLVIVLVSREQKSGSGHINRELKQMATAGAATATGSKIVKKRVIAHVRCSHPAVAIC